MRKSLLSLLTILVMCGSLVAQQSVTVNTFGVWPYDVHHDETGYFDTAFNGLTNVGINTKVYFKGMGSLEFTAATWTLTSQPGTSVAVLGGTLAADTNIVYVTFAPDVAGAYVITFADGDATTTITINAGTYLGVEGGNCVLCHSEYVEKWEATGHADMFTRAMEGTLSDHYGENCISCHVTGYDTNADNNGFDDRDFVYPAELTTGVFAALQTTSPDAMMLANIQCESCHGPAYAHGGAVNMSNDVTVDACATCHAEAPRHIHAVQWRHSGDEHRGFHGGHAVGAFAGYAGGRAGCAGCHSGAGFVQWIKEGMPVTEDGIVGDIETVPAPTAITCAACHDPHDNTLPFQLRNLEGQTGNGTQFSLEEYGTGALCMTCHRSRRNAADYLEYPDDIVTNLSSHFGPHHAPQADMLLATNVPTFGLDLPTSPHLQATEDGCVDCHMALKGYPDQIDEDGNVRTFGGHTFNMVNEEGEHNVASCAPCHGEIGETFGSKKYYVNGNADLDNDGTEEGLQEEVQGLLDYLASLLPQDADGNVAINDPSVTTTDARAGYNYFFVYEDRSLGVHNPAFTVALLKASIEAVGGVTGFEYPEGEVPTNFELSQNYPNPFNPTTNIKFNVSEQSNVKLTVYDALGREVTTLVNSEMSAGTHQVTWNAANIASGIYFYRMEAGDFVTIKKMLLMK